MSRSDFTPRSDWQNKPSHATPLKAEDLLRYEAGINGSAAVADVGTPGTATGDALRAALGLPAATTVTISGALVEQKLNPVDATGGAKTMTLPTGQGAGTTLAVEKVDSSSNIVTVTGSIRGVGSSSITLVGQHETLTFAADSAGSWWPIAGHKTKAWLDTTYVGAQLPERYGAVGNGTTDDTAALQAAVNALDSVKGGTVWLAKDYNFTSLTITNPRVTIAGPGKLRNGTVYIGVQSGFNPQYMWTRIACRFDRDSRSTTVNAIEIANSINVDITGCEVANYRALVHFPGLSLGGSNIQHSFRIKVSGCYTQNFAVGSTTVGPIDYLVYVSANVTGGIFSVGDLTVVDNPSVQVDIAHIWGYQLDGLVCKGNTFFHLGYSKASPRKLHCIYLNFCDWVNITGNQLFEAGYEAINLTDPRNLVIQGNNIAWPGERDVKDAIAITVSSGGYCRGMISGNNISLFTLAAVGVYGAGTANGLVIGPNATYTANPNPQYYGSTTLPSSFNRYTAVSGLAALPRVAEPTGFFDSSTTVDNIGGTGLETAQRLGTRSGLTVRGKNVTVTAATPANAGGLSGANASTSIYGGQIDLFVQDTGGTHCAHYVLAVSKSSTASSVTTLASNGETSGASAISPSFTFSLSGDNLIATPVGSTAGTFAFYGTALGNLRFL